MRKVIIATILGGFLGYLCAYCATLQWGLRVYPLGEIDPVIFKQMLNMHLAGNIAGGVIGMNIVVPVGCALASLEHED